MGRQTMALSAERLQSLLDERRFNFYSAIGSTNDVAMAWLAEGAPAGSVVIADEQTQGRGRLGRTWFAPPGTALMLTYLMRPSVENVTYIGMMGALAVCEVVESFGVRSCGIKWPNDVQLDGRKLCGILPEAAWQSDTLVGVALGIGLNVRVDFSSTPFSETATSLETAAGQVDRADVLLRLLDRLDYWTARLDSQTLFDAWRDRLVVIGRHVSIHNAAGEAEGIAESVDRQGALLVREANGVLTRVVAGDIALG